MKTDLQTRMTPNAGVTNTPKGFRLSIPGGDNRKYRVAQLDDYTQLARKDFPHRPSLSLSLRARTSAESIPGTWGFGLWNDPFGLSIGFGGNPFRIPALPNTIWFFHASEENYLSFTAPVKGSGRSNPGNGFLAQVFHSPAFPLGRLARVGATLPFSRTKARALMSHIVEEEGVRLDLDTTEWHEYRFEWCQTRSTFWVDNEFVLESSVSPRPPLGLVIWIDNQYAAFTPEGKIGFGLLANAEPAWLEIENLKLD